MKFTCTSVNDTYTGVDPQWSVHLAYKWCEYPEWLHVNTTPLFSLVRDCGSMFGLALAAPTTTRYVSDAWCSCSLWLVIHFCAMRSWSALCTEIHPLCAKGCFCC